MGDFLEDTGIDDIAGYAFDPANLFGVRPEPGELAARENQAFFDRNVRQPDLQKLQIARHLESLSPTELKQIQEDPQLLQAQLGALGKLQDITAGGGLSAADRGRIGQIGREEAITERGQRQAILQNAQARGLGGSGLEMQSLLGAQQAGANRAANRNIDVENLAQQRALQAINAQGALAGNIRGQNYDKAAQAALAQDAINRFNIGARNVARTAEQEYNTQVLPQQRFQNQLAYNQGRAGMNTAAANETQARKNNLQNTLGTTASVFGSIYGGGA